MGKCYPSGYDITGDLSLGGTKFRGVPNHRDTTCIPREVGFDGLGIHWGYSTGAAGIRGPLWLACKGLEVERFPGARLLSL